jgi:hypothetical protein
MVVRILVIAAALVAASPVAAHAGTASISHHDVALGTRSAAVARTAHPFDLLGLHWQGAGSITFRTRSLAGTWSSWHAAAPEAEDLPDAGHEQGHSRWRLGNPWWTGPSDRFEIRTHGRVSALRAWLVRSSSARVPLRQVSLAGSPPILTRQSWNANEKIRRNAPRYAAVLREAVVHHTAGGSGTGPESSAAIVRAIQLYHVKGNGWDDIGYNFLVDRFGQVFEGRSGGADKNVIGAHAQGFNTGSVGVAVIGSYMSKKPSRRAEQALAKLLAWRLDVGHVDPASSAMVSSGGNPRFRMGEAVYLPAISGHRDTGFTACPGDALYARLGALIEATATTGLPKLYVPAAHGAIGKTVAFSGRLSQPLAWSITVTGPTGARVARKTGVGDRIAWSWPTAGLPRGRYTWVMTAGPTDTGAAVRPASGVIGSTSPTPPPPKPPALLSAISVSPGVVSPDGDGDGDLATIAYTLGAAADVTVTVDDEYGLPAFTALLGSRQGAGKRSLTAALDGVADGRYRVTVVARRPNGAEARVRKTLLVMRAIGWLRADPPSFSPDGDGISDTILFSLSATKGVQVVAEARQQGVPAPIAAVFSGWLDVGTHAIVWNGVGPLGTIAPGSYELRVTATDEIGSVVHVLPFTVTQRPG